MPQNVVFDPGSFLIPTGGLSLRGRTVPRSHGRFQVLTHPPHFFHIGSHYSAIPLPQLAGVLRPKHALHSPVFLVPPTPHKLDLHLHPTAPRLRHSSLFYAYPNAYPAFDSSGRRLGVY
jgi:hypothetical protein